MHKSSQAIHGDQMNGMEKRRRRICGPKSRFGCVTCKKRHLKCDETTPTCMRCSRDGWACDGYPSKKFTIKSVNHILDDRPTYRKSYQPPKILPKNPFNIFPGSTEEHRFFHLFTSKTALDLGLFSNNSLWNNDVSRIAFTEKPVQHALIAVAALHEDRLRELESQEPINKEFSLSQYNKAIHALNSQLSDDKSSYQIAVITCLLFIYLEFLKGSPQMALTHLHSGLKLLPHYRRQIKDGAGSSNSVLQKKEPTIDEELARTLSRFRKTTLGNDLIPLKLHGPIKPSLLHPFTNLEDAKECLHPLIIYAFKENTVPYLSKGSKVTDAEILQRRKIDSQLKQWALQIEDFIVAHSPPPEDLQVIRMLRVLNLIATISNLASLTLRQVVYDKCIGYFKRVVSIIEEVSAEDLDSYTPSTAPGWVDATSAINDLSASETSESTSHRPPSEAAKPSAPNFDHSNIKQKIGIAFPLYFTAIKCRSPSLRRKALSLIPVFSTAVGTPGNTRFLREVARFIIKYEESQCLLPVTEDVVTWPTEKQRIQMVYFLPIYDLKNKTQSVMFVQQPDGPGTEMTNWLEKFTL